MAVLMTAEIPGACPMPSITFDELNEVVKA
jgi:hypothetical protein